MTRKRGVHAALAVAALLATTAIAAGAQAHEPDMVRVYKFTAPGEAEAWSNATLPQQLTHRMLESVDGNGDEEINASEAADLEAQIAHGAENRGQANTALAGREPTNETLTAIDATNAEGPITEDKRLHVHGAGEVTYPVEPNQDTYEWHRSTRGSDEGRDFRIRAPPGYEIGDHEGVEDAEVTGGWLSGSITSAEDVNVTFTRTGQAPIPSPGIASLLVLVVAARLRSPPRDYMPQ